MSMIPETNQRGFIRMLNSDVAAQLKQFHIGVSMRSGGCLMRHDDMGPRGINPPLIPYAPFDRSRVFTGTRENGSFNHHSQLIKFKDRYFFAWSNGIVDEENAGQRILISSSPDGQSWTKPICIIGDKDETVIAHNAVALMVSNNMLYVFGKKEDAIHDAAHLGMRRINPETTEIYAYCSEDGKIWNRAFSLPNQIDWIFEAPRLTADGHLMTVAALKGGSGKTDDNIFTAVDEKGGAALLRWPGDRIEDTPEITPIPQPFGAVFPYAETSWYQTDDGTIVMYWRDEGQSCRVWVNYSTDGGKTFTEPMISDIPDSQSRVYAGKLEDGRYFLCNNAFPELLNRHYLMLLLSDNGYEFNNVYILVDDPTAQRFTGLLKVDGYQYPFCLPDGDKLFVGFSVNKEDIECGIVDLQKI